MARPSRCRRVCAEPSCRGFIPQGEESPSEVALTVDEYEVIRLVDYEKWTHEQCAAQMGISRTTVTEIYENARFKLSDSLVNGKALSISGGHYRVCRGDREYGCGRRCRWADEAVNAFLSGTLEYSSDVQCGHHGHEHHDGHCGENKHGCGGEEGSCGS